MNWVKLFGVTFCAGNTSSFIFAKAITFQPLANNASFLRTYPRINTALRCLFKIAP